MASQSKYQNAQLDALLNDLLITLEKHKAPVDLSLMALGNTISHILTHHIANDAQRVALAEAFTEALKRAIKTD